MGCPSCQFTAFQLQNPLSWSLVMLEREPGDICLLPGGTMLRLVREGCCMSLTGRGGFSSWFWCVFLSSYSYSTWKGHPVALTSMSSAVRTGGQWLLESSAKAPVIFLRVQYPHQQLPDELASQSVAHSEFQQHLRELLCQPEGYSQTFINKARISIWGKKALSVLGSPSQSQAVAAPCIICSSYHLGI